MSILIWSTEVVICLFILSFHFWLKDRPGCLSFSYADLLAFVFSLDKSIGSVCFFPGLDPFVYLIGHATITEMIKLQFTTTTDKMRNKIRNGNWFPKFSINRKEQKFLPICLQLDFINDNQRSFVLGV